MKIYFNYLLLLVLVCCLSDCATFRDHYSADAKQWQQNSEVLNEPQLAHTIYLLGNGAAAEVNGDYTAIKYFQNSLEEASANSIAILLGDNTQNGFPSKKKSKERNLAEGRLKIQLNGLTKEKFAGRPIVLMGDQDWGQSNPVKGIERQEKFINKFLDRKHAVYPDGGCGTPSDIEITDDLVIIAIDSQWWIEDWSKLPEINDGCEINTREYFLGFFEDMIKKHKGKNIIIALHHPPYTNGPRGGEYSFSSHIFPFKDANIWVPLPVIGTIINAAIKSVGTKKDRNSAPYTSLVEGLVHIAEKHESVVFVSAHEKAMEYFEVGKSKFVVSGAVGETDPTKKGNGAVFTSSKPGHVRLHVYEDGAIWAEFYAANPDGQTGSLIFKKQIKEPFPVQENIIDVPLANNFDNIQYGDLVETTVYPESEKLNLNASLFGKYNNDLFYTKVKAPVLLLDQHEGGMEIIKAGGSTQTLSLRLKNAKGRVYNLRSLRKDPTRSLPGNVNYELTQSIMSHFLTGANPFGAFVVPDLAEATGVLHTRPKLYYMPRHRALGEFNDKYGNQLYLLEERPDDTWLDTDLFGDVEDIISYKKLFKKINSKGKRNIKINQPLALRTRLLDILIGDFDRHLDQFRFGERKTKKALTYDPIPRDRDLAFSAWDGLAFKIGTLTDPKIKASHTFGNEIKSMKWLNYQARGFDKTFLNELDWDDFRQIAEAMQKGLSDSVIEKAVKNLPEGIYKKEGTKITTGLKKRRDDLITYARQYYELINETVEILGTDNNDIFEIDRLPDGYTRVQAWVSNEELKEKKRKTFDRTFDPSVTSEIQVFGLDDEDLFIVKGDADKGIKVRLIGGYEEDIFKDQSNVRGLKKMTIIQDARGENIVEGSKETKDNRSTINAQNTVIFRKDEIGANFMIPTPMFGFNVDDGFILGLQLDFHTFPFRKYNIQRIGGIYPFTSKAFQLEYSGDFEAIFNSSWDFLLNADVSGPEFTQNFFGSGNRTRLIEDNPDGRDFYRIRRQEYNLNPSLKKSFSETNYYTIGLLTQAVKVGTNADQLIGSDLVTVDPAVFDMNYFSGVETNIVFDLVDKVLNPANGLRFNAQASWRVNLNDTDINYANINSSFTYYQGWGEPKRLIFATRVGWSQNIGDSYFYQRPTLGDGINLRGYRRFRFTGNSSFYHNTDLRLRLFSARNKVLPFTVGILGGLDYGRVWDRNESSDDWHVGTGGGLWISPLDITVINFSFFRSEEEHRFTFSFGFLF